MTLVRKALDGEHAKMPIEPQRAYIFLAHFEIDMRRPASRKLAKDRQHQCAANAASTLMGMDGEIFNERRRPALRDTNDALGADRKKHKSRVEF